MLHENETREPCEIKCPYDTSKALMEQCGVLLFKVLRKEASKKRDEVGCASEKVSLFNCRCIISELSLADMH